MGYAETVVSIATAEEGYKEKASNSNLDSPSANAGSANYTKYARDLAAAGYYNGSKQGFEWCDVFADWVYWMAYGKNASKAQAAQCQSGPLGAACPYSANYYKAKGRFSKTPQLGDQVFFQQGGSIVHTGIVIGVTSTTVTTIEGNSGNCVKRHTYNQTDSYIAGYGHPIFDDSSSGGNTPAPDPTPAAKKITVNLSVEELSKANKSTGPLVKTVQRICYAYGFTGTNGRPIAVDGEFGANTDYAVRKLQKHLSLPVNGVVGKDTWTAMLTKLT